MDWVGLERMGWVVVRGNGGFGAGRRGADASAIREGVSIVSVALLIYHPHLIDAVCVVTTTKYYLCAQAIDRRLLSEISFLC